MAVGKQKVEGTHCPTCGHKSEDGNVKIFEVPQSAVIDPVALETETAKITDIVKSSIGELSKKMEESITHPPPSRELIAGWDNCPNCRKDWEHIKTDIAGEAVKSVKPRHDTVADFLTHVNDCPDCRKDWDGVYTRIATEAKKPLEDEIKTIKSAHVSVNEDMVKHWDNCPECQKGLAGLGFGKLPKESPKEVPKVETKAEEADIPVWRRDWNERTASGKV